MSVLGTLGKVAMGILVAKGVGKIMGNGSSSSGGLLDGLGGLLGGDPNNNVTTVGGLGGLLSSLGGNSQDSTRTKNNQDFATMFNEAIQGKDPKPSVEQEQQAKILLYAMVSAAKADGKIDPTEQKKILAQLKHASKEEVELVRQAVRAPLNLQGLIDNVPKGMEQQVYLISLLAIDLDVEAEVRYLKQLAKGLNISREMTQHIHNKLGAPQLYT